MTSLNDDALVLTAKDVIRLLDIRSCIDAIARTLRAHEAGSSRGPDGAGVPILFDDRYAPGRHTGAA